jgi:hypothetical protein
MPKTLISQVAAEIARITGGHVKGPHPADSNKVFFLNSPHPIFRHTNSWAAVLPNNTVKLDLYLSTEDAITLLTFMTAP